MSAFLLFPFSYSFTETRFTKNWHLQQLAKLRDEIKILKENLEQTNK